MELRVPREMLPWFPTIDYEECTGCGQCFDFCKNDVFEWNEEAGQPVVAHPYNCVVGCSACANLCDQEAIRFPTRQELKKAIDEARDKLAANRKV